MYRLNFDKGSDNLRHWTLPDRVFFACGACHILAYAFLERYSSDSWQAVWIKPAEGFTGNHIFISSERCVFDYHGYARREKFITHTFNKARRWWPGWHAELVELPSDVLISEPRSKTYDGLWLREPQQFIHDALPRARRFLDDFAAPQKP